MTKRFRTTPALCCLGAASLILLAGCGQQAATDDNTAAPAVADTTPVEPGSDAVADATASTLAETATTAGAVEAAAADETVAPVARYPRDEIASADDADVAARPADTPTAAAPASVPAPATPARPSVSHPVAGHGAASNGDQYATVIAVKPVKRSVDTPREVCQEQTQTYTRAPKDDNRIAGGVIGGVIGGVAGSQVGSGRGRDLATVAGAIGGAVAGRRVQEENQRRNQRSETHTETVCKTVTDSVEEIYAYDIDYEYGGRVLSARIDHDPGERVKLPVRSIVE